MTKKLSIAIAFWAAKELLGKSKNSLNTQPSAQFHLQKWNFNTSGQKLRKSRYQSFLILPSFAWLLYYLPNILSGIIVSSPSVALICVTGPWVFSFNTALCSKTYFAMQHVKDKHLTIRKLRRNYLASFKFTRVLTNAKLWSYFLKCAWINTNQEPSDFSMILNYYRFHLMQFLTVVFYLKRTWKKCFFIGKTRGQSQVSVSTKLHELRILYWATCRQTLVLSYVSM